MPALETLGWDAEWNALFEPYRSEGLVPGRVAVQHRIAYDVLTEGDEVRARVPGRLRHETEAAELPVVGDWIALEPGGAATIRAVLPRRTKVSRLAAESTTTGAAREHVVAANVDVIFIAAELAEDLDPRLVERYLALAWESGAQPVVLLTKADLEPDADAVAAELSSLGGEVPIHAVSARTGLGLDAVRSYLAGGSTGALLGPSGVGKSTLVNELIGEEVLRTAPTQEDGSGRHTTTRRELVPLPGGGLIVDNPGIRELQLWLAAGGLEAAFDDIVELESECRFSDCRHETEPGCAVQAALADGRLALERWEHYRGLQLELAELEERLAKHERSRARRRRT